MRSDSALSEATQQNRALKAEIVRHKRDLAAALERIKQDQDSQDRQVQLAHAQMKALQVWRPYPVF